MTILSLGSLKIGNKLLKSKVIVDSDQFIDMLDGLHWEINKLKLK